MSDDVERSVEEDLQRRLIEKRRAESWLDDTGRMIRDEKAPFWVYYMDTARFGDLKSGQVGKWMSFFTDVDIMADVCRAAVLEDACIECKHTHPVAVEAKRTRNVCFLRQRQRHGGPQGAACLDDRPRPRRQDKGGPTVRHRLQVRRADARRARISRRGSGCPTSWIWRPGSSSNSGLGLLRLVR